MRIRVLFSAAVLFALLLSIVAPSLVLAVSASPPVIHQSEGDIDLVPPDVVRVHVHLNHHAQWPFTPVEHLPNSPAPWVFSGEDRFRAPLGVPGVTWPDHNFDSRGWLFSGQSLGAINRATLDHVVINPTVNRMPATPSDQGAFEFRGWNSASNGSGNWITSTTPLVVDTTLFGQWAVVRQIGIRHRVTGGSIPTGSLAPHEIDGGYITPNREVGSVLNLADYTTNFHGAFFGVTFYTFQGWTVAVGNPNTVAPSGHMGPGFSPGIFAQDITVPYPLNFSDIESGRLYLIANWRAIPPGTGIWVPPPPGDDGGGGGGGGAGQQTSPPGGDGGVVGGGGGGVGPGGEEPSDEIPSYTAVPETGGAPLIPIDATFPVVPVPPAVTPMPSIPSPGAPVVRAPSIAGDPLLVPIVGLESESWALLNLVLAVLGGVGAVCTVVYVWLRSRRRRLSGEEIDSEGFGEDSVKRRKQWLFVMGFVSLFSLVLFPLTQDMSNRMVLVDVWTLAHVLLFVCQFFAIWRVFTRKRAVDGDDGGGMDMQVRVGV